MMTTQLYFAQSLVNTVHTTQAAYQARGVSIYTNENDLVRRQTGVSGQEDIFDVTLGDDGVLHASRTLGASHV